MDVATGTLPLPPDLYDAHDFIADDFGMCIGCAQEEQDGNHYPPLLWEHRRAVAS